MAVFNFSDNLLHLEINGLHFDVDPILADGKLLAFWNGFDKLQKKLEEAAADPKTVQEACEEILGTVDGILGGGASSKIFEGRVVSFYDCVDLIAFLRREVSVFGQKKNAQYAGK